MLLTSSQSTSSRPAVLRRTPARAASHPPRRHVCATRRAAPLLAVVLPQWRALLSGLAAGMTSSFSKGSRSCWGERWTSAPPPRPPLHRDWTHPRHICIGTGLTRATSAPGLRSPVCHICVLGSPARLICTGTETHPCHICTALRSDTTGDSRARLVVRLWRSGLRRYKADSECVMLLSERVNEANRVAVMVAPATPIMAPRSVHNDIPMNQHWLRLRCSCDSGAAWAHPYCGRR